MDDKILNKLGLLENEKKVYLALLSLGNALASKIAEKCNLHRTNVYSALDTLAKKGLVSFIIKENRRYFEAADPEMLLNILNKKEQELAKERTDLKLIISELKSKKTENQESLHAKIYKGKEGFKVVMEDIIKSRAKEWLILGGSGKGIKLFPYFMPGFLRRVAKAKISCKVINIQNTEIKESQKEIEAYIKTETRYLPKEIRNMTVIHIYSDKVALIPITNTVEEGIVIFLMKNKKTAEAFRDYFNYMWRLSKP